ncbi:HAD family hydrolase [Solirubrobacter sp. CPCC 204708]|uniref:HAD hydrolase-like protein n=1 Tax=Solirubrobacter deserti TaxID=2282478 RepID=A0ABT4RRV9_9ACTN|nr:HAD hydrolase-like protein [Solirubrobacter deserti]MBE2318729.1 HAD family hydrolase [Solirubrobacter deserti]MDA0141319.1 HAD hydrolase-like protein [Solirubrobacter deserti]
MERIVIFDLDDTLVHSSAVREAFACVARERGIDQALMTRTLDALPGRPAQDIFECLGCDTADAQSATERFLARLDELNGVLPTVAYADADATLRELAARGTKLVLSTGSSPERARRVIDQEGWEFEVVLGSTDACRKGRAHYEQVSADMSWTRRAITVGDSPTDMRLGAEHGVPVRIAIDRDGDPRPLLAAGATHVVRALSEILTIV